MTFTFRRFRREDAAAIRALNGRLEQAGVTDRVYPEGDRQLSEASGDPVTQELYVAADGNDIRGGVWLHEHQFMVAGRRVTAGWLKYPVSESLINRSYGGVPGALIFTVLRRQPHLMALGMGGGAAPLARLLRGMGWSVVDVPFGVAPLRAGRVLKELRVIRRRRSASVLASLLTRTGIASVASAPLNALRSVRMKRQLDGLRAITEPDFGPWSDRIWEEHQASYPFIGRRDARMLSHVYPVNAPGIARYRIERRGSDVGWLCTRALGFTSDACHPMFGGLKVGMIVDGVAHPDLSEAILAFGVRELAKAGADIVVSNQLHPTWRQAMKSLLLAPAPSNFTFAYSKGMRQLLETSGAEAQMYINRGDCDGPPWW